MPVDVKICGLSTPETLDAAIDAGADLVGLVFFPKSPRNVSIETAARLAARARSKALVVALIVDADDTTIADIKREVRPDIFQAHGNETPERIDAIRRLTGNLVIKAIKVKDIADVEKAQDFVGRASFLLFDAKSPENSALPGGNGLTFDWTILKNADRPFMLSGGLTPGNVAEAIRVSDAAMVDVSSGVESAPGIKDVELIRKFIEAAKRAS